MLVPCRDDNVGPKGLVGGGEGGQIGGGKIGLELGCFYRVQEGLHVWMCKQTVHHSVGAFAADGFIRVGDMEVERLEEVAGISDRCLGCCLGFSFRCNGDEIVTVFHCLIMGVMALEGSSTLGADGCCCCCCSP